MEFGIFFYSRVMVLKGGSGAMTCVVQLPLVSCLYSRGPKIVHTISNNFLCRVAPEVLC